MAQYRVGVLAVSKDGKEKWFDEIHTSSWDAACDFLASFIDMWLSPGWRVANVWIRDAPVLPKWYSEQYQI